MVDRNAPQERRTEAAAERRTEAPAEYGKQAAGHRTETGPDDGGPPPVPEPQDVGPGPEVEERAPGSPTGLPRHSWVAVLKGSVREFVADELTDRAAALTYYGVLALFPGLLVLVSLLGVSGPSTADKVLDTLQQLAPGPARDVLGKAVENVQGGTGTGAAMAVVGLVLALWSASGYVGAFMRAANKIFEMPEGRPVWKVLPIRLGMTAALMVMAAASALIIVFTGDVARRAGDVLGLGDTALTVWSIAKWPVLVLLVTMMIALLYWGAPNAKGRGWRWVTPGSAVALLIWMAASAGFALYVAEFASYNKTYGTMAGVIVFLIWLWISNLAVLLGLEFDAEALRQRAVAGGMPPGAEPYVEPRDTRAWSEEDVRTLRDE
ncbi:YihY/virulence factor BrkB family protein [Streptomyces sp. NPDC012693]|jgi:membrane protein|uniref:YihY/virulence factor BrkB family protein n=1 Tax=unclassified Streptomyces TaxID=2593676 RepID=UPI00202FA8FF|nr:YihY/virulence factor BrkB family protein [Streptomyces sp. MSC1_001]